MIATRKPLMAHWRGILLILLFDTPSLFDCSGKTPSGTFCSQCMKDQADIFLGLTRRVLQAQSTTQKLMMIYQPTRGMETLTWNISLKK